MTKRTYFVYNHGDYDLEGTGVCVVDVEAWPHFEELVAVSGWTIVGSIDGEVTWRMQSNKLVLHDVVTVTGPVGILCHNVYMDENTIGWIPSPPTYAWSIGVNDAKGLLQRLSNSYAAIASAGEAEQLYEGLRRSYGGDCFNKHGECKGIWAVISDAADALLRRATGEPDGPA